METHVPARIHVGLLALSIVFVADRAVLDSREHPVGTGRDQPPAATAAEQPTARATHQLRVYTINKGRLDDFIKGWREHVYPLRQQQGYKIPFAYAIRATNQFVWLVSYDGPETWEAKEKAYYSSSARKYVKPDPADLIARPEQLLAEPVISPKP